MANMNMKMKMKMKKGMKPGTADLAGRAMPMRGNMADKMGRAMGMNMGGMAYSKGGSASSRADGVARKGKTKGKMV